MATGDGGPIAAALAACGASGHHTPSDGGTGIEDAGDRTPTTMSWTRSPPRATPRRGLTRETSPRSSVRLLTAVACTGDTMCCSGFCNQGECGTPNHPADVPGR